MFKHKLSWTISINDSILKMRSIKDLFSSLARNLLSLPDSTMLQNLKSCLQI
jgi:hypothetical protein